MPDQLLPQPPPDAPAPPPGEEALNSRRKMRWIISVGVGSMALLLLLPVLKRKRTGGYRGDLTPTTNNARVIGVALYEFQLEYGKYPDTSTSAELRRKTGSTLSLSANTSNDLFAQLLAGQVVLSEKNFYAKAKSSIKPDDVWSSDATALAHGECAFAYIMGVDPNGNPSTPLAFGPVIPGTKTFDREANYGRIAVIRMDHSVIGIPINPAGKVIYHGLDLLDPRQPFWHGKAPDVKWPKGPAGSFLPHCGKS